MHGSENQSRIMQRIYNRTTAEEQRWIVHIILKGSLAQNYFVYPTANGTL